MGDFSKPSAECDIIMKGGATSGIVYPNAVLALAKDYRFRSIGGASAGAVAAAITAAAEYGRAAGGFERIAAIPDYISANLASLFQPDEKAKDIFEVVSLAGLERKYAAAIGKFVTVAWPGIALGFGIGIALAVIAYALGGGWPAIVLALVIGGAIAVGAGIYVFARKALALLAQSNFGLCSGRTAKGSTLPAVTDWLTAAIEAAAGENTPGGAIRHGPLTFGDLWKAWESKGHGPAIDLLMMTTNLSMQRPNVLPYLSDKNYFFREDDFRALFPDPVVDHMIAQSMRHADHPELFYFPKPNDLPVVVGARISLSFPLLIAAVPLYRLDFSFDRQPVKLLFSDGGISSNFPIHFFDGLLPRRPTFGISLGDFDGRYPDVRVRLSAAPNTGQWSSIGAITDVVAFVRSIFYSAKNWQDSLQSALPGYRERIVHVYLKASEGGLNLTMDRTTIRGLVDLGARAGDLLDGHDSPVPTDRSPFNFDEHRWRRFLVAFACLEETLANTAEAWGDVSSGEGFGAFVKTQLSDPPSFVSSTSEWRQAVFERFDGLMRHVRPWQDKPLGADAAAAMPNPPRLRITPKY